MNKAEFIDAVAAKAGLSKKDTKGTVDAVFLSIILNALNAFLAIISKISYKVLIKCKFHIFQFYIMRH